MKKIVAAVIGQPNVGKSTLFNVLTRSKVHVANWPGVTVQKHVGKREYRGYLIEFVDLPGTYGFSSLTIEEKIARNYIFSGEPDVILVLVDSLNPERTFYLAIQAMEITNKVIIVLTKYDAAHSRGIHINRETLEHKLRVPVIRVSAITGEGIDELLDAIIDVAHGRRIRSDLLIADYGELNPFIDEIIRLLEKYRDKLEYPLRWTAIRLLEGDPDLEKYIVKNLGVDVFSEINEIRVEAEKILKKNLAEIISTYRFKYINSLLEKVVVKTKVEIPRETRISRYLYNPLIGPLLSILILIGVFLVAFIINLGFPLSALFDIMGYSDMAEAIEEYSLSGLVEKLFTFLGDTIYGLLGDNIYSRFIVDGILGGVGAVLVFAPLIFTVSLFIAMLEDSGLAPRIAVGVHNLLAKIGVSGHAVFPLMVSLGCNVPAIMSVRSIPDHRERFRLILSLPFIPCQARLVVMLALASAVTNFNGALLIIYGYIIAFSAFALINKIIYIMDKRRGYIVSPELLLEIPPLHKPIPRVVWWLTWNPTKHFLVKAGVIIFSASIFIWFITSYTASLTYTEDPGASIAAQISRLFTPLLAPIGLDMENAWILILALLMGFIAKEVVVSTLLIATGADRVREAVNYIGLNDPQITGLTVFSILYVPCLATLAVMLGELRSLKYTLLAIIIMMSIAYIAMIATYYIGILLNI